MRPRPLASAALMLLKTVPSASASDPEPKPIDGVARPNILVILTDDVGWGNSSLPALISAAASRTTPLRRRYCARQSDDTEASIELMRASVDQTDARTTGSPAGGPPDSEIADDQAVLTSSEISARTPSKVRCHSAWVIATAHEAAFSSEGTTAPSPFVAV
jgi:hypothetical protein